MKRTLTAADRMPKVGDVLKLSTHPDFKPRRVVRVEPDAFWVESFIDDNHIPIRGAFKIHEYTYRADGGPVDVE